MQRELAFGDQKRPSPNNKLGLGEKGGKGGRNSTANRQLGKV